MSLRPIVCGLSVLLVAYSYWASGVSINILACVCTFMITGTIMAWNDWCDRYHDAKLGKTFALVHGRTYFWYCVGLWGVSLGLIGLTAVYHWQSGVLGLAIAITGFFYTNARKVVLLSELFCAGCLTAVVFYPVTEGNSGPAWYLYAFAGIANMARENVKNTDHPEADRNWKKTLSVLFGNRTAIVTARFMLGFAVIMGLLVAAQTPFTYMAHYQVAGMLLMALAGHYLLSDWFPVARKMLDLSALLFVTGGMSNVKASAMSMMTAGGFVVSYTPDDGARRQTGFPEYIPERVIQPRWVWTAMIILLFVVVAGLRFVTATSEAVRIFIPGTLTEALITGGVVIVIFLALFFVPFFAPAFDESEEQETRGYRIVKRMSSGLLLGAVCSVIGGESLIAPLVMFISCVVAIIWHPTACWAMKQRGFQLGTIIGFALIGGITYGLTQFLIAYIPTVAFYYLYRFLRPGSG